MVYEGTVGGAELLGKGVGRVVASSLVGQEASLWGLSPSRGGTFSFLGTEIMLKRGARSSPVRSGAEMEMEGFW